MIKVLESKQTLTNVNLHILITLFWFDMLLLLFNRTHVLKHLRLNKKYFDKIKR